MEKVQNYLNQILQNSFLSKHEKREWSEEMQTHLIHSIEEIRQQGHTQEQAINKAFEKFGAPDDLRNRLTRETFGFTSSSIVYASVCFLILFAITKLYCVTAIYNYLSLYRNPILNSLINITPFVFLTLFSLTLLLFLTRKRIDRICLLFSPLFFILANLQVHFRFLVHSFGKYIDFVAFERLFYPGEFDATSHFQAFSLFLPFYLTLIAISSSFLLLNVLILFLICKNRYIAIAPFLLSITYTIEFIVNARAHYLHLLVNHSPLLDSSFNSNNRGDILRLIEIALNILVSIGLVYLFKTMAKHFRTKRKATT